MVGSMNRSERIAFEWLLNNGYSEGDITRRNAKQTPDFICSDKNYEVKLLYGKRIVVYENQIKEFDKNTYIIVTDKNEVIENFKWEERDKTDIDIKIIENKEDTDNNWTTVRVSEPIKEEIERKVSGTNINEKLKKILNRDEAWIESKIDERVEEKMKEARGGY